jgi:hypothetical protein
VGGLTGLFAVSVLVKLSRGVHLWKLMESFILGQFVIQQVCACLYVVRRAGQTAVAPSLDGKGKVPVHFWRVVESADSRDCTCTRCVQCCVGQECEPAHTEPVVVSSPFMHHSHEGQLVTGLLTVWKPPAILWRSSHPTTTADVRASS